MESAPPATLSVEDLRVRFPARDGWSEVVRGVSFALRPREFVGLVGESGSGKSLTALSILRLVPPPGEICGGRIRLGDTDLLKLPERQMQQVRGARIGMVFQEPASALNPVLTIGFQVAEAVQAHRQLSRREARQEALRLLDRVGLADARARLSAYPHQLSGGQRQRVLIAVALAAQPQVLLADEPTTALDATLQAQILELLEDLRRDLGLSVLLITHDLGVVSAVCDRAVVLYNGEVVEQADTETLFRSPANPYTRSLLEALLPLQAPDGPPSPAGEAPLLEVAGLVKDFRLRRSWWRSSKTLAALRGVSLAIARRECLAVVGESGSGKTTLGRCMIRLVEPTQGDIRFAGTDLRALAQPDLRRLRRRFQMIFQDPHGSLDPRQPVGRAVAEPLTLHRRIEGAERQAAIAELLQAVGLSPHLATAYPHQLSGGQRQRVGIARALACRPDLVIADEPTSALDALVRVQILRLLMDLRQRFDLTLVLITHDLSLVVSIASRVAVLYLGRLVEVAPVAELFARPQHPYTVSLLTAIPRGRHGAGQGTRERLRLRGEPPNPLAPPAGCPFHPRCPVAGPRCAVEEPELAPLPGGKAGIGGHRVACFHPGEVGEHNLFQG